MVAPMHCLLQSKGMAATANYCEYILSTIFMPIKMIPANLANIGRTDTIGSGVRNLYKYTNERSLLFLSEKKRWKKMILRRENPG